MIHPEPRPLLIVISAPSGTGKTTLCDRLISEFRTMKYSVSCTTRSPRDGEIDGVDYHFISEDAFEGKVKAGDFLEHAEVHGRHYGTLRDAVMANLRKGIDVLMDIDVQGAAQIRDVMMRASADDPLRRAYVDVFIAPPSLDVLHARLKGRGKDSDEVIERRMQQVEKELACWRDYQYFIINDRLDATYDTLRSIIIAEHHRLAS
ncbi:MAG TPA: guanylate kinase [Kiritimatiellia bacterium]|nr:guanylate kinase [Kiritimatiellia bacterium]HMO98920.1 guanylate kinase [Kiritimatiellia bacterium]HMP95747.1 guanylate kinase [Kiritimatiellia bacterium]